MANRLPRQFFRTAFCYRKKRLLSAWIRLARIGARGSVQTPIRAQSGISGRGSPRNPSAGFSRPGAAEPGGSETNIGIYRRLSIQGEDGCGTSEDPAPVMRGLVVGAARAGHGLFLERWEKRKGDPGRFGRHSRAPGCPLRKRSAFHRIRGAFPSGEETRWQRNRGAVGRCRRRHGAPVLLCGKASMASGVISKVSLRVRRFR